MEKIRLPRDQIINVRLEKTLREKLDKAAAEEGATISSLVRYIIDSMIAQYGVGVLNGLAKESLKLDDDLRSRMNELTEKKKILTKAQVLLEKEARQYDILKDKWIEMKALNFSLEAAMRYESHNMQ